ncbi:zinc transporter 7 like [Hyalella azteca]|uniref:Zinc transporter 7 like n=1 Tax=Hyalella azteca TaxID=294128 RepID=A0A6A0GRE2_HYAAZ|nr:zinc transporter 7-B-like [Hyalella azteca]KAA0185340.1 zinc transporter 7 like [Hyalella azteca]
MLPITIDIEDTRPLLHSKSVGKVRLKDTIQGWVRLILSDKDSRNLFFFLLLNFSFAFVELSYGMWTNSLGLISDAFHMFFDCSGLLAGLAASIITKWSPNERFTYGYVRAEILGGFVNGLLLMFVSFFIFAEAVERAMEPPEVKHERLFVVSVLGFLVNIVGIFVFQHGGAGHGHSHGGGHGHSHGGGHGHSHGGGHGHSHGGASHDNHDEDHDGHSHNGVGHGHSHGGHGHSHGGSQIMQGVFLHILADTLGSVGVIISSILMYYFNWMIADPICSMFIAVLIFLSVLALLRNSVEILLQRTPRELDNVLPGCYQRVRMLPGVFSVQEPHFWTLCTNHSVGNIKLEVSSASDARYIVQQTTHIFKSVGVKQLYVQLDFTTM